jgi:hypothetical protein
MDAQEFAAQVDDLEKKLDRLRAMYEQYFMGIEKIEPGVLRREVERLFQALRRERCNNTAQRFRFQTLVQRYTTLSAYWQRICRAIEEGTYQPHILRAQRLVAPPPPEEAATGPRAHSVRDLAKILDLDLDPDTLEARPPSEPPPRPSSRPSEPRVAHNLEDLRRILIGSSAAGTSSSDGSPVLPEDQRVTVPPPAGAAAVAALESRPAAGTPVAARPSPAAARPSPAAARPSPDGPATATLAEEKVRSIHAAFSAAAEGAAAPSPTAIRQSLEKELERMTKKHPGRRVDFRVELKNGKPVIKSFVT